MNFENSNILIQFFLNIDIFLLILVRVMSFMIILPVLSSQSIPNVAKISLAVTISSLIFISGKVNNILYYDSIIGYALLVIQEFMVGFIMGFVVYVLFSVLFFVGQLIDYQIGFSMVSVLDPLSQIQVPVTGNLLYLLISILFIETGGLDGFIAAFFYSYDVLPIGLSKVVANDRLILQIIDIMVEYFTLGVKIALPIMGSILVLDAALGVLVKAVPQMNIFVVGMPIKLLVGLVILILVFPIFITVNDYLINESYRNIINIIGGMSP